MPQPGLASGGGHTPRGVHLVGSVPLRNAEAVFRTVGAALGSRLRRIPDGETGDRTLWVTWQWLLLAQNPAFQMRGAGVIRTMLRAYARFSLARRMVNAAMVKAIEKAAGNPRRAAMARIRPGVRPEDIRIGPLGYAAVAKESYQLFTRLKREGAIPSHLRFQVSLPTPLGALATLFSREDLAHVLPAYEACLLAEVDEMVAAIPPGELAIQWDTALEFGILEGHAPSPFSSLEQARGSILDMLVRLGNHVPLTTELGYHLCYGDAGHKHFRDPVDAGKLVDIANALTERMGRPINWIHFPVPRPRSDEAYFAPLRKLRLDPVTELYAGLVHLTDGVEGTRRRIATAQRVLDRPFGVATECGLGRRLPATIPALLRIHAEVSAPVAQPASR